MRNALVAIALCFLTLPAFAQEGWSFVQAESGAVFAVGLVAPMPQSRAVTAVVCVVDHGRCPIMQRRIYLFTCDGHYKETTGSVGMTSPVLMAAPNSVMAKISQLACERGHSKLLPWPTNTR